MSLLRRKLSDDAEEVTGVVCFDPETGPVGAGPHGPRPDEYKVYEGIDGKLKIAYPGKDDGGRLIWDDDQEAYVRAREGEQKTNRPRIRFMKIPNDGPLYDAMREANTVLEGMSEAELRKILDEAAKKYGL